jgi:hypothetical protein
MQEEELCGCGGGVAGGDWDTLGGVRTILLLMECMRKLKAAKTAAAIRKMDRAIALRNDLAFDTEPGCGKGNMRSQG